MYRVPKLYKNNVNNKFCTRLRELRLSNNLTVKQLAERLKRSRTSIYGWEKGINEPSYDILLQLSEIFNVTLDYLLGNTDI